MSKTISDRIREVAAGLPDEQCDALDAILEDMESLCRESLGTRPTLVEAVSKYYALCDALVPTL